MTTQRKQFEQWYATHAFNYERDPIGSRDCGLQWAAWQAAQEQQDKERATRASDAGTINVNELLVLLDYAQSKLTTQAARRVNVYPQPTNHRNRGSAGCSTGRGGEGV